MLRSLLCVGVALCCCSDFALAAAKAPKAVTGTIKAIDKDKLTVTVTTTGTKKKPSEDKEFTIPDGMMVTITGTDSTTKDVAVKDALKDPIVVVGATIKVTAATDGTVSKVEVGGTYTHAKKKAA